MDMLVAGGGIDGASIGGIVEVGLLGLRDWLKRRINEELRAGRCSAPVPGVNASGPMFTCVAG